MNDNSTLSTSTIAMLSDVGQQQLSKYEESTIVRSEPTLNQLPNHNRNKYNTGFPMDKRVLPLKPQPPVPSALIECRASLESIRALECCLDDFTYMDFMKFD